MFFRTRSLVLQKYFVGVHPLPSTTPTVEIVGRMEGVIAYALSLMGYSPITRLTLAGSELRCESTSLFGQSIQLIPIRQVSNLAAGIHKPVAYLILATVINLAGLLFSVGFLTGWTIAISLVVGIALVVLYAVSKKFFVEIHSQGGPAISLLFTPNILEGIPINADSAMAVIGVICDMVMASGTTPVGFAGSAATTPIAPVATPMIWGSESPSHDVPPPDSSPFPDFPPQDESAEVIEEQDDYEPAPEPTSTEVHELHADAMLTESKQIAARGDRRRAIQLLKTIVTNYPTTKAAQQACRTLERSGIHL